MLTAAGVGSGLDIESMISQLMALENRPLDRLQAKKSDVQLHISANGQLRSALSRFQVAAQALADSDTLGGVSAASSNADVLTVSATASADTQSHDITVVRLATTHRLTSNAYANADTAIGTGTLDITVGADTLSLTLDGTNNTLTQVRDAINASTDNPGVTASIINVDAGSQLMLTANQTGTTGQITVTPGGGLAGFSTSQVGVLQDALVQIDGFDLTSTSNTITSAIAGVTLDLVAAGSSTTSFSGDSSLLKDGVEEFVNAYNSLRGNMKALGRNALSGDSVLLGIERSINQRLTTPLTLGDGSTGFLFEAGVSFNKDGDLTFNASDLAESVAADPARVLELFGGTGAYSEQIDTFVEGYMKTDGILDTRNDTLESRDRVLDRQISNTQFRLDKTESRLREQFTALDSLLAQLTVTSDYLSQQLQSLPGANNNN